MSSSKCPIMSPFCLSGSAGTDLLFPGGVFCCKGTGPHALQWSKVKIASRECEVYHGGSGRSRLKAFPYLTTRKKKLGGGALPVRFQSPANREPQQEVGEGERSWGPLGVSHKVGEVVGEKYRIRGFLGQGGVGTTYEAEIIADGTIVALKALSLTNMKVWKALELFQREARVLNSLRHPNIPEYVDYFEVDSSSDRAFYIAQKVAKGSSLAELVQSGWRFTEEEVLWVALEILEVLNYLGALRPPVYHRDIKPENVIVDMEARAVKVVDFGAVQDAASVTLIGSTVVGTYGYMAPEQFQNRATSQTDLYGLGGTLLFVLSGRSPSFFPQKRLKVDFSSVSVNPRLAAVIDRLLEPAPEDRFQSPLEVIKTLRGADEPAKVIESKGTNGYAAGIKQMRPAKTKVVLERSAEGLKITIPPGGLTPETVGIGSFAVAWNTFIAIWTRLALQSGIFALFSLPFWGVGIMLAGRTLSQVLVKVKLKMDEQNFSIEWKVGNFWKHRVAGNTADISSADLVVEQVQNGRPITTCRIVEGVHVHNFGSGLELVEKRWIIQEIRSFLRFPPDNSVQLLSYRSRSAIGGLRGDPWDDEYF